MSYVPITGVTAVSAAAVAAQQIEEEEQMATYNRDDLDGWEFKIMRSTFGRFKNRQAVERVRAEESRTGWELVEKFDDYRLRFKRRVERRSNDHLATIDPYRTSTGSQVGASVGIIVGMILLLAGIAAFFFVGYRGEGIPLGLPSSAILLVAGLILVLGLMVLIIKKRR